MPSPAPSHIRCDLAAPIAAALLLLADGLIAQAPFDRLIKRHLPPDHQTTTALALGDVDGDGDLDRISCSVRDPYGASTGVTRLDLNDGNGTFTDVTRTHMPALSISAVAVALGDVDGDGDPDIVAGSQTAPEGSHLFLNDGSGGFRDATLQRMPSGTAATASLALGDVDRDGDLDIVLGIWGRRNRLYTNDGTGSFSDATASRVPADTSFTSATLLADVDGDGDLDLLFGNVGGSGSRQNRLHLNDGSGRFSEVTSSQMPVDDDDTRAMAAGDVDGDGDHDLVLGNGDRNGGGQDRLYSNDGTGRFRDVTARHLPVGMDDTFAVALADVDADGDLDALLAATSRRRTRLYVNDGTGVFADATVARMPEGFDPTVALADGDVDGDGDGDVLLGCAGQDHLYFNDGAGFFADAVRTRLPRLPDATRALALEDVDGDGDRDLVVASYGQSRLFENDGAGGFSDATATRLPALVGLTEDLALGDVDGDGDPDLVLVDGGRQNRLYSNDGAGVFRDVTVATMPADSDMTLAVVLHDLDADGDLDMVLGNLPGTSGQDRLYLNDGRGRFTDVTVARMPTSNDATTAIALGDFDGDGDVDLALANIGQSRLLVNDGTASFLDATATALPSGQYPSLAVAAGDFDGDGDVDLVLGDRGPRLYANDGTGRFADVTIGRMPRNGWLPAALVLDDFDGDGDADLLSTSDCGNQLYWNDGTGTFSPIPDSLPASASTAVGIADVDDDGDADLVLAGEAGCGTSGVAGSDLYLNLQVQLDTPFVVKRGSTYRIDVHSHGGRPRAVDVALPFLAPRTVRQPLPPLGVLRLDPAGIVPLAPFLVPQPAGVRSLTVQVPNDPNLYRSTVHAQAVLLRWPGSAALLNLATDRIWQ